MYCLYHWKISVQIYPYLISEDKNFRAYDRHSDEIATLRKTLDEYERM